MEVFLLIVALAVIAYFVLKRKPPSGRQQISTEHLPDSFVVLDLETTGLDATRHEIIEIAAIRYRKGGTTHDTYQSLVKPKRKVPKKITEITGITQEMVERDGKQLPDALHEFTEFIGSLRLVTFNADFDMAFLHTAWETHGLPKPKNPVSCALKMARRAWPRRKSFRLADLASDGEFAAGQAHRALEDARRALIVYAAAVAELKSPSWLNQRSQTRLILVFYDALATVCLSKAYQNAQPAHGYNAVFFFSFPDRARLVLG